MLDTTLAVQLTRATDILLGGVDRLLAALRTRAFEHKMTPTVGRSHGIHAEPMTFGLKLAGYHAEFERARRRLVTAREEVATCALSGAVGTFANVDPSVEAYVGERMGPDARARQHAGHPPRPPRRLLRGPRRRREQRSNASPPRSATSNAPRCARHRSSSRQGQKGSSAMPHKRNPILTENLTGLARLVRMAVVPAMENVALWHERDISHSSVERGIGPDSTIHLDFALHRMAGVIEKLVVYPERMQANLDALGGLVFSQRVLLALTQAGASREDGYRLVQRNAMRVWDEGASFLDCLSSDAEVTAFLPPSEIEPLFDMAYHTAHVDTVFERVFGESVNGPGLAYVRAPSPPDRILFTAPASFTPRRAMRAARPTGCRLASCQAIMLPPLKAAFCTLGS